MFTREMTFTDVERLDRIAAEAIETFVMDEDAFRAFYDRTARSVWSYLARITGDRALADDLLQESYYRFLRAERRFDNESHRRNYLFRIATNLAHDRRRRGRRAVSVGAGRERAGRARGSIRPRRRYRAPDGSGACDGHAEASRARDALARLRAGLLARGDRGVAGRPESQHQDPAVPGAAAAGRSSRRRTTHERPRPCRAEDM